jgi:uncharacterized damage-inducible protein DinB
MREIQRILDQFDRAFEGNAWHGPAVRELLTGVSARQAAAKPPFGSHSIWEIVLHMAAEQDVVRRRVTGEVVADLPPEMDWPAILDTSENTWLQAVEKLTQTNQNLRQTISQLPDQRLEEIISGKGYSIYFMLHGVIHHNLYHAGQIAILKKLTSA